MDAHLDALLAAIVCLKEPEPADLVSCLRGMPELGLLPSPWDTWTLIGLTRHRERQFWVAEIIRNRLRGAPADLAAIGAFGQPDGVPQSGPVPGMPEWEYYFHGRGCCISHKVDGDAIDVDFWDDSADYFDTFFYKNYLESLRRPEPPEQRLRELHPSARAVTIAITDLLAAGALTPLPGSDSHPYRLADEVTAVADDIASFCTAWPHPDRRVWLAALIGDWLAADDAAAGRPELTAVTGPSAARCREIRWHRLRRELGEQYRGADALQALADLGPPSGLISAALDVIGQQDDPRWCARVHKLFSRVDPAGQIPQPHIWITSLKFLLRHGHGTAELITSLAKAGRTEVGEAVLLSLEHAPELALPLIRKALLDDVPIDRTQVAAILALIKAPWSQRELLGALEGSRNQEKTADVRAALLESGDEEAQKTVLAWEARNPHENETGSYLEIGGRRLGPFYTFGELSLKNRASRIRYEMDKLHDRVMKLKDIVPPEPPARRPWWKFWGS
ncbi:MAG: hypothetical protein E6K70_13390 [Planctomycetota bacterium]|nr:MAG: hypothetical protein E6K70_13390 [Planctomycetota bacterium]